MAARRRRMEDADYQESILADRQPGGAKVMSSAAIVAERSSLAATAHDKQVEPRSKEVTQTDSSLFTDFAVSDMGAVQSDAEADPVAEADVYLAYGRYQQAEELIRNALNRAPQRNELRYKLLEVLFAAKNTNAFDTEAEALLATLGSQEDEMWVRVVEMGQELNPGNPLYRAGGVETVTAAAEQGLDFDLGELSSFVPQTQEAAPNLPVDKELSFDLSAGSDFEDAGEGLLASADEVATKLDLARAYLEMGDPDGARSILQEVLDEGNVAQKSEAQTLLSQMG
jgi:pilus assembly protein FimV